LINLNHDLPAAPAGATNVTWQSDVSGNASAYVGFGAAPAPVTATPVAGVLTLDATTANSFNVPLTANVTSSSVIPGPNGEVITITWQQNVTGGWTVVMPTNFVGATPPSTVSNAVSIQQFQYNSGTNKWYALAGSPVLFETNTTPNISQTTLNLIAGTNVTLSNASAGNVTINATGGGGSGVTSLTGDVTGTGPGATATTVAKIQGTTVTGTTGTGAVVLAANPALTGIPTAPTAALATNTTQIATTAFVIANAGGTPSRVNPLPTLGSFTQSNFANGGSPATAQQKVSNGAITLSIPGIATLQVVTLMQTPPVTPYSLAIQLRAIPGVSRQSAATAGIYFGNASSTRRMGLEVLLTSGSTTFRVEHYTSQSADSGTVFVETNSEKTQAVDWCYAYGWGRIRNDGTSVFFDVSYDFFGENWVNLFSETIGTFLATVDQIGFGGLNVISVAQTMTVSANQWLITNSAAL
jgi:hypothetical protein